MLFLEVHVSLIGSYISTADVDDDVLVEPPMA